MRFSILALTVAAERGASVDAVFVKGIAGQFFKQFGITVAPRGKNVAQGNDGIDPKAANYRSLAANVKGEAR